MNLFYRGGSRAHRRGGVWLSGAATLTLLLSGCASFNEDAPEVATAIEFAQHLCNGEYLAADAMVADNSQHANPNITPNSSEDLAEAEAIAAERRDDADAEFEVDILDTRSHENSTIGMDVDLAGTCEGTPFSTTLSVYEDVDELTIEGSIPLVRTGRLRLFQRERRDFRPTRNSEQRRN